MRQYLNRTTATGCVAALSIALSGAAMAQTTTSQADRKMQQEKQQDKQTQESVHYAQMYSMLEDADNSLTEIIGKAEQRVNGKAYSARLRFMGGEQQRNRQPQRAQLVAVIRVVDAQGNLTSALYDMQTGNLMQQRVGMVPEWDDDLSTRDRQQQRDDQQVAILNIVNHDRIIDRDIHNYQGDDLGTITDLAIVPSTGKIAYAMLDYNDRWYPVPVTAFQFGEERSILDVDEAKLRQAQSFEKDRWPNLHDRSFGERIFSHWEQKPYWDSDTYRPRNAPSDRASRQQALLQATEILDSEIVSSDNEGLAEIEELAIDLRDQRVAFVVAKRGGVLGIGEDVLLVPFAAMLYDRDDEHFVLDMTEQQFENAMPFDSDNDWARISDPEWSQRIYTFYNVQPYWDSDQRRQPRQPDRDRTRDDRDRTRDDDNRWQRR